MKKIESLLYFGIGFACGFGGVYVANMKPADTPIQTNDFGGKYGNWLAAQHAIFVNDFDSAVNFMEPLRSVNVSGVSWVRNLVLFLGSGDLPDTNMVVGTKSSVFRIINMAAEAGSGKWVDVYNNFKNEKGQALSPFRIWSGVATGKFAKTLDFINGMPGVNDAWKNFTSATIYAATGNPKTARKFFRKVPASFLNLGDYHFVMSFYKEFGFKKDADALRREWTSSPGGMYMATLDLKEDWRQYDSYQKMLAAGLVQNVSHNGEDAMSDASLLVLRVANALGGQPDAINYYMGGYFYASNSSNYKKYWDKIENNPIYAPFVAMKNAEKAGSERASVRELRSILRKNPLFMPAIMNLWKKNMQNGRENDALRILNRALKQEYLSPQGRAYLLKMRAHTFYIFGEYADADQDIGAANDLLQMDAEIMGLQAKIWAKRNRNLDEAYRYAISLITAFPSDIEYWNVLATVVMVKEGDDQASDILERVGRVAEKNSELFLQLGNLRAKKGLNISAAQAYKKAISLSDDGLVIREDIERKLRRLK